MLIVINLLYLDLIKNNFSKNNSKNIKIENKDINFEIKLKIENKKQDLIKNLNCTNLLDKNEDYENEKLNFDSNYTLNIKNELSTNKNEIVQCQLCDIFMFSYNILRHMCKIIFLY